MTTLPDRAKTSQDGPSPPSIQASRPRRSLACALCHQRKVKCDRSFPCSNCTRSGAECVPATATPRQRRRRFPERTLLGRLRKYEELLKENKIQFDPLHPESPVEKEPASVGDDEDSDSESADTSKSQTASMAVAKLYEARDLWYTMSKGMRDTFEDGSSFPAEEFRTNWAKAAWDELFETRDYPLLGSRNTMVDLSTLHPSPAHSFRLWQIYLDNVDPLFKVTHTPSLQPRIIEAISNVKTIDRNLEALMFSIYSIAGTTLTDDGCLSIFGSTKNDILSRFHSACEQALLNCNYLRTNSRECITALVLYLMSISHSADPRSLSSMLGVAMRLAKRMGLQREAAYADCNALEAELRRRLWWALLLFDSRISELVDHKSTELTPTWNCRIPLNVNDSALSADTKEPPTVELKPTEGLFVAVRSEMANFMRQVPFYLEYSCPALKFVVKETRNNPEAPFDVASLEKMMEEKYLKLCDLDNPLHFMATWTTRGYLARLKLFELYFNQLSGSPDQRSSSCDTAVSHAITMLESDAKMMSSPLTKGFIWLLRIYFPLPAYIHIIQDLRMRPDNKLAHQAWEAMADNYQVRCGQHTYNPLFKVLANYVLQTWNIRVAEFKKMGREPKVPRIVAYIRQTWEDMGQEKCPKTTEQQDKEMEPGAVDITQLIPGYLDCNGANDYGSLYNMSWQPDFMDTGTELNTPGFNPMMGYSDMGQLNWAVMGSGFNNWSGQ